MDEIWKETDNTEQNTDTDTIPVSVNKQNEGGGGGLGGDELMDVAQNNDNDIDNNVNPASEGVDASFPGVGTGIASNNGNNAHTDYLYTRSPSSGSGSGGEEDDDEEEVGQCEIPGIGEWAQTGPGQGPDHAIGDGQFSQEEGVMGEEDEGSQGAFGPGQEGGDDECSSEREGEESGQNEQEDDDGSSTFKLFVSNLPPGLSSSELRELFEKVGEVKECEVFAKNYAFVHMGSEACGFQAIDELNGVEIKGCKINVKRSVQTKSSVSAAQLNVESKKLTDKFLHVRSSRIYVRYLPADMTKERLTDLLKDCGNIVELDIRKNHPSFVYMETQEGGQKVIEKLNGLKLPDSETPLKVADSTNPRGPKLPIIKLRVKNISVNTSASEVRTLFQPYGLVLDVKILPPVLRNGTRTGTVMLEQYGNIRSAIREISGKEVDGACLSVKAIFDRVPVTVPEREVRYNLNEPSWHEPSFPPPFCPPPPPRRGFQQRPHPNPSASMRLIPMPSQADFQRFPRGAARGRVARRSLMTDYGNTNNYQGGDYSNANYDDTGDFGGGFPPPNKRSRGQFSDGPGPRNNNTNTGFFPDLPPPEKFPPAAAPALMSVQIPNPHLQGCDFSADVELSSFGGGIDVNSFSNTTVSTSTHAVPFDYSNINMRKKNANMQQRPMTMNPRNNSNNNKKWGKQAKGGKGFGKPNKGKARHPGLGTPLQQKKLAEKTGEELPSSNETLTGQNNVGPGTSGDGNSDQSPYAPYYFTQNWSFKSKRPTAKQIKEAEEEQKRQYADYLKQKPWLYQAIPGTVKKIGEK